MRDIKYRDEGRPEDLLHELGYETQDIAYKKFSIYGAYFFGFLIVSGIAGFVIMYFMSPTGLTGGKMSDVTPRVEAPLGTPLLQSNITARTDMRDLRQQETKELESAGETKVKGVYHIPIDKAIDNVAKAGDADRAKMGLPPATSAQSGREASVAEFGTRLEQDRGDDAPASGGHSG
jgi:hypothetical protein